jgi:hypothetical protein
MVFQCAEKEQQVLLIILRIFNYPSYKEVYYVSTTREVFSGF